MKPTRKQLEQYIQELKAELSAAKARENLYRQQPFVLPTYAVPNVPTPWKTYTLHADGRCEEVK